MSGSGVLHIGFFFSSVDELREEIGSEACMNLVTPWRMRIPHLTQASTSALSYPAPPVRFPRSYYWGQGCLFV